MVDDELTPQEIHDFLERWRVEHDENPAVWHTRKRVQSRISCGLPPCPYCKIEEIPSL